MMRAFEAQVVPLLARGVREADRRSRAAARRGGARRTSAWRATRASARSCWRYEARDRFRHDAHRRRGGSGRPPSDRGFDDGGEFREHIPGIAALRDGELLVGWEAARALATGATEHAIRSIKRIAQTLAPDERGARPAGTTALDLVTTFLASCARSIVDRRTSTSRATARGDGLGARERGVAPALADARGVPPRGLSTDRHAQRADRRRGRVRAPPPRRARQAQPEALRRRLRPRRRHVRHVGRVARGPPLRSDRRRGHRAPRRRRLRRDRPRRSRASARLKIPSRCRRARARPRCEGVAAPDEQEADRRPRRARLGDDRRRRALRALRAADRSHARADRAACSSGCAIAASTPTIRASSAACTSSAAARRSRRSRSACARGSARSC